MSQMRVTDIERTVRHIVAEQLRVMVEEVDVDADLRSLPRFDSIHALQIVLEIEQHYDIEVEDHIVFETSTVREFTAAVAGVIAEAGSEPVS
ncbi:acyl carrier protein [Streptomyces ipomoeae]|uniref:Acyl carrier protein n=2 Tax=Streptomyces ipomoeae TaxID=103232 RepID=A0AAE8VWY5_9ACTN|nr:acyl carrier protein [Streptomyces ipomoeae]EKX66282.1 putative acyl carrier protein [Streptomyces ipomoeae 91-03]MDX2698828.1 acyl carrier protein [Streptomyces ipomoeae]MDX2826417.1 acyl carrier protein [Streptomyces ipomoeae]MDX2844659.1 acyl carrier protein [Streptomyces ipomoeae]MDX2879091.1 acyl carrier protein [Streptomyces ipomoeae]